MQRDVAVTGAPPAPAPVPGGGSQPPPADGPAAAPQVTLYPVYDRRQRKKVFVDAAAYEVERQSLARLLRYFAKEIPADMRKVLDDYPYGEIAEVQRRHRLAQSRRRRLRQGGPQRRRLLGPRLWALRQLRDGSLELFKQESVWSYVGKRVGADIIGFIEGAAEAMVGPIDQGAGPDRFPSRPRGAIHKR
ncbi:MAG: hypothetical protein R3C32_05915 [Chloroflexota bacterium]